MVQAWILEGREVQNCELKHFLFFFRDNFCVSNGYVERLPPIPHRDSGFCSVLRGIFCLHFLEAIFRWHLLFLVTPKFRGKIQWKNSVIGSEQKRPGANRPPEFVPESPLQKGFFWESYFL